MTHRLHWRNSAAGISAVLLTALVAGQTASAAVPWRAGPLAAAAPLERADVAGALDALASRDQKHFVIGFDQPITPAQRTALRDAGISLHGYLTNNAFFASFDDAGFDATAATQATPNIVMATGIRTEWKLHPLLLANTAPDHAVVSVFDNEQGQTETVLGSYVTFHDSVSLDDAEVVAKQFGATVRDRLESINGLVIEMPLSKMNGLASQDEVEWIEPALPTFSTMNVENRAVTNTNAMYSFPYNVTGDGVTAFVYDAGTVLTGHSDYQGRATAIDGDGVSNHPTHVGGTVAAGGPNAGMAPDALVVSAGFEWDGSGIFLYENPGDIEADYANAFNNHDADIANNSIGTNTATNGFPCSITGDYGVTASVIDAVVRGAVTNGNPTRIVWANGNERQTSNCGNQYNTTAPPAGAKNHITVGALNSNDDSMTSFSSWGPVDDGRMKPDISAPGCQSSGDFGVTSLSSSGGYSTLCGTSMASPTVCGIGCLLIELHRNLNPGSPDPRNSTLKALLAHNADDLGNPGPDNQFGYGRVNSTATGTSMLQGEYLEDSVDQGGSVIYLTNIGFATGKFRATIAWDDAPATPNVANALVNNLDLVVTDPNGVRHYPWTLDGGNPGANAVRTQENTVDNIEQVLVDSPIPGTWTIEVRGTSVPEGPQPFSLVTEGDLTAISAQVVGGVPELLAPNTPLPLTLQVAASGQGVVESGTKFFYRFDGGAFTEGSLTNNGNGTFSSTLPGADCDDVPEFYFEVEGSVSGTITVPAGAPANTFGFTVGEISVAAEEDMETNPGWSVGAPDDDATTGIWERANPEGGAEDHRRAGRLIKRARIARTAIG